MSKLDNTPLAGFRNLSQAHAFARRLVFFQQSYDRPINFYVPPDVLLQSSKP